MRAFLKTRGWRASVLVVAVSAIAGCGGDDFENNPRPAESVDLTGVIADRGVTVSPSEIGAGPVRITIVNETDDVHTVTLEGASVEATVGPVNPQDTATIQKTLPSGDYEVRAGSEQAVSREIPPAELTVGPDRDSSNNTLLLP
jgi:hypothetical protein